VSSGLACTPIAKDCADRVRSGRPPSRDAPKPDARGLLRATTHAMDRVAERAADSGCPAFGESHKAADSERAERPADDGRDEMEGFVAFDESSLFILS
jgi:hypothetical protein